MNSKRNTLKAIAACALTNEAELWTQNPADFADIPGLVLHAE